MAKNKKNKNVSAAVDLKSGNKRKKINRKKLTVFVIFLSALIPMIIACSIYLFNLYASYKNTPPKFEYEYKGLVAKIGEFEIYTEDLEKYHNINRLKCIDCAYYDEDNLLEAYANHYRLLMHVKNIGLDPDYSLYDTSPAMYLDNIRRFYDVPFKSVLLEKWGITGEDIKKYTEELSYIISGFTNQLYDFNSLTEVKEKLKEYYPLEIIKEGPWNEELPNI